MLTLSQDDTVKVQVVFEIRQKITQKLCSNFAGFVC